jgi:hypothetical protein
MVTKKCSRCGETKDESEFYFRKKTGKSRPECKECEKEREKKRYQDNPENKKEREKKRYQDNPENKKEREKKRYQDNPEKYRDQAKKRYQDNPEKHKAQNKKYRQRYGWINASLLNHKYRGYTILTTSDEIIKKYGDDILICAICGDPMVFGEGGQHAISPVLDVINNSRIITINNIQPAHHHCNIIKSDRSMEELLSDISIDITRVYTPITYDPILIQPINKKSVAWKWAQHTYHYHKKKFDMSRVTVEQIYQFYLQKPTHCTCGNEFHHGKGKSQKRSPTLDRIENKRDGLTIYDFTIICHDCNTKKSTHTRQERIVWIRKVLKYHNRLPEHLKEQKTFAEYFQLPATAI